MTPLLLLLSQADAIFGRDAVTGSLAAGVIVALLAALYFAQVAHEAQRNDDDE